MLREIVFNLTPGEWHEIARWNGEAGRLYAFCRLRFRETLALRLANRITGFWITLPGAAAQGCYQAGVIVME